MSELEPNQPERLAARVTELEELLTHFERTVQDLNEVLLQVQNRLDTLESRLEKLSKIEEARGGSVGEDPSIHDERPPHY